MFVYELVISDNVTVSIDITFSIGYKSLTKGIKVCIIFLLSNRCNRISVRICPILLLLKLPIHDETKQIIFYELSVVDKFVFNWIRWVVSYNNIDRITKISNYYLS